MYQGLASRLANVETLIAGNARAEAVDELDLLLPALVEARRNKVLAWAIPQSTIFRLEAYRAMYRETLSNHQEVNQ